MRKKDVLNEAIIIFWLFIIGSVLGYIFEMIVVLFQKGHFEVRQGLLYGPFIPVYGIGAVVYYITFKLIKTDNKVKVFLIAMILGGITEYICSYVQEKAFGSISWDYSYLIFDFNGRTSLLHCTYWGIAGVLYITYIKTFLENLREKCDKKFFKSITAIFVSFILFDVLISCMAADREFERRNNIRPENNIDVLLDKYYPDEVMDSIFTNKKDVCK